MKRKGPITAVELHAQLENDLEFIARRNERERALAEVAAQRSADEAPIVAELRTAGFEIESVWDLVNRSAPYPTAIPILLKHLKLPYTDFTRDALARALAVPDARFAWPIFAAAYREAPTHLEDGKEAGAKDGLACALSATVTEGVIDEMVALAKDRSNGDSRLLLLRGLKKSKSAVAKQALEELASDPALSKEIASWRKRKPAVAKS